MSESVVDDAHAKRRLKVIQNTSASQVSAFAETCNRYWFYQSVEGLRDEEDEKPAHLTRGSHIDSRVERALNKESVAPETITVKLNDGAARVEDWTELVKAVLTHLPDPNKHRLTLQHWGRVPAYEGGPVCIVKPDVMHCPTPKALHIDDLKTTSDFKYCKSAEELAQNIQLNTYSRYGYEELGAERVTIAHAYARTKWDYKGNRPAPARAHRSLKPHGANKGLRSDEPCECAECKAWLSNANRGLPLPDGTLYLPRAQVDVFWQSRIVPQVKLMVEAASTVKDAQELPPSTDKCSKIYGQPCPFRERCGFNSDTSIFGGYMDTNTNGQGMSLSERLKLAKEKQAGQGQMTSAPNKDGGVTVGGGGPPAVNGYKPGQGCNGRGFYASTNGQGFVDVEAGHVHNGNCTNCIVPFLDGGPAVGGPDLRPTEEGAGMHVLPPEVRHLRESTPEQVAQAEMGKKRGRPKKVAPEVQASIKISVECVFCGGQFPVDKIDAHKETLHAAEWKVEKDKEEQARKDAESAERRKKEDEFEQARQARQARVAAEQLETVAAARHAEQVANAPSKAAVLASGGVVEKLDARLIDAHTASDRRETAQAHVVDTLTKARTGERKVPPEAPTLYVDCYPRKGAPATMGDEWLAPIAELAALANVDRDGKSAPMEDFRLIPYTADGVLAVAIRACLDSCPARLAFSSESRTHRVAIEVLTPFAREIVGR